MTARNRRRPVSAPPRPVPLRVRPSGRGRAPSDGLPHAGPRSVPRWRGATDRNDACHRPAHPPVRTRLGRADSHRAVVAVSDRRPFGFCVSARRCCGPCLPGGPRRSAESGRATTRRAVTPCRHACRHAVPPHRSAGISSRDHAGVQGQWRERLSQKPPARVDATLAPRASRLIIPSSRHSERHGGPRDDVQSSRRQAGDLCMARGYRMPHAPHSRAMALRSRPLGPRCRGSAGKRCQPPASVLPRRAVSVTGWWSEGQRQDGRARADCRSRYARPGYEAHGRGPRSNRASEHPLRR